MFCVNFEMFVFFGNSNDYFNDKKKAGPGK